MKITEETITPDIAREWLDTNQDNRPRKQANINRLADDMSNGRWKQDGAPFRFDKNGVMLDGQHRCLAIIKSGVTLKKAVVIRGLEPDAFVSIDTGARRSASDVFYIRKERYHGTTSGAALILAAYIKSGTFDTHFGNAAPSSQECIDTLEACPRLRDSVAMVGSGKSQAGRTNGTGVLIMSASLLAALHYLFTEKDNTLADAFLSYVITGESHGQYPAFHLLRERLVANRISRAKLPREFIAALAVKAWNSERTKVPLKQLKFTSDESFPEIK